MRPAARLALPALALLLVGGPPRARGDTPPPPNAQASGRGQAAFKAPPRLFLLVDFPYQLWSQGGTLIHVVAFTPGFRPAAGAEVSLKGKRVGYTNRQGTLVFRFKSPKAWKGADLVVRHTLRGQVLEGRQTITAYRRTSAYEQARVYLYTDRGIYRPGDRLRARLVAFRMRDQYEPLAGQPVVLTLRSPYGEVRRLQLRTDAFGVAHTEVDLAELEPVRHTLTAQVGRARHARTVKLAHFKRPAVELRHTLPSWFTDRSPHLTGAITVTDLDGASPKSGRLDVTVTAGGKRLAERHFALDGRAKWVLSFPRAEVARFARAVALGARLIVTLKAALADGTSAENEHAVRREAQPFRAVVELDRDDYRPGAKVTALVKLSDPDDLPAAGVRVTLAGPGAQRRTAYTNAQGTATFRLRAPPRGAKPVTLQAFVAEVKGPVARATVAVEEAGAMESTLGVAQVVSRRQVPISVVLDRGYVPLEGVLHVDVTDHSGAIVAGFTLPWRRVKGRWVAAGRFKAPSWGSMLLTMFSLGARAKDLRARPRHLLGRITPEIAGVLLEGQQVTVQPDEALRLRITGLPRQVKPGAPLSLKVQVRGPDGKPRDALVGGALVDANVLALGDPLQAIAPVPYFYNPELRTLASTGSKMLTWPVVARTWGCHRYDIALPPFEFVEGGPVGCATAFGMGGAGMGGGGYGYGGGGAPERFTIRQRFDPTSWWAPALRARGGRLRASLTAPDTISRQVLLLVASDRRGGIGVARQTLTVRAPLSLELDVPDHLAAGEELEVVGLARNGTGRPLTVTLAARAQGLATSGLPWRLRVPPGPPTPFRIRLRATRPGPASLELRAWQGAHRDALRRTFTVRPAGAPQRTTLQATARRGQPARLAVHRRPGDAALLAAIRVDYPHVIPALQSATAALAHPSLGGDSSASVIRTAALVLQHGDRLGLPAAQRARLGRLVHHGALWLLEGQRPDGAFHYWRHGLPDALHTAYVLETLLDARAAGARLPEARLRRAAWYLLTHRAPDGLWDVSRLAFWEGRGPDVRTGLSASIFRAVARASSLKCQHRPNAQLVALAGQMARYVRGASRDPRTVAAALEGLHALYYRCEVTRPPSRRRGPKGRWVHTPGYRKRAYPTPAQHATLAAGARHLLALRSRAHWEPTWFDAYGGQLEATAAALRVLWRLDPRRHAAVIREAVAFLQARRGSWGEWHNERGTAAAIRALIEVAGAARPERPGATITLLVNRKPVRTLRLDPKDPWATAAGLGQLRLTQLLRPGKNTVEVRYDGHFALPVRLALRRWPAPAPGVAPAAPAPGAAPAGPAPGAAPAGHAPGAAPAGLAPGAAPAATAAPAPGPAPAATAAPAPGAAPTLQMPATARLGARLTATLTLPSSTKGRPRQLVLRIPAHLAPDAAGLRALRRAHPWLGLTLRGSQWTLTLPPRPPVATLALPLRALRRGLGVVLVERSTSHTALSRQQERHLIRID